MASAPAGPPSSAGGTTGGGASSASKKTTNAATAAFHNLPVDSDDTDDDDENGGAAGAAAAAEQQQAPPAGSISEDKRTKTLFYVRRTAAQMLKDRGYVVQQSNLEMGIEDFKKEFGERPDRSDLMMVGSMVDDPMQQISVHFLDPDTKSEKIGVEKIKAVVDQVKEFTPNSKNAILILPCGLTPFANQGISEANSGHQYRLELFMEKELIFNITHHQSVPTHQLLSELEKRQLLERYKVKSSQLPRIQAKDPVARYMGLRIGDVVRIVRASETAGRYVTYRMTV